MAFIVHRFRATENRGARGARQPVDDLRGRLADERLGLPGSRSEARAPEQAVSLGQRDRRAERLHRRVRGRRRRGRGGRERRPEHAGGVVDRLAMLAVVVALVVLDVPAVLYVLLQLAALVVRVALVRATDFRVRRSPAPDDHATSIRPGRRTNAFISRLIDGCRTRRDSSGSSASSRSQTT